MGVFILGLTSLAFREKAGQSDKQFLYKATLVEVLSEVLKNRIVWINAIVAVGIYLSVSVLADLWGTSFIIERLNVSKQTAVEAVSLVYVGLFVGSLVIPLISDFLKKRKLVIIYCIVGITLFLCLLIYLPFISIFSASVLLFSIGFLSGAEMLCFAGACEAVSSRATATVTGLVNGVVMLSVAFAEHQVGRLLDLFWKGNFLEDGLRLYSAEEFQYALTILPIVVVISFLVSLYLEDHLQRQIACVDSI
jgi:sugar phosphate permease